MTFQKSSIYTRGEVYKVSLDPTQGSEINKSRPCVIVGANPINRARSTIIVIPLSSSVTPRPPLVIPLISLGGNSVAVIDQIRAVDKSRIIKKIADLTPQEIDNLDESLRQVLAI